jgi:hypothetical protein
VVQALEALRGQLVPRILDHHRSLALQAATVSLVLGHAAPNGGCTAGRAA